MNTSSVDPQIRPWVRFWARQLDYSFGGLILAVLDTFLLEVNDTAFPFIVIFAWVFVESWLLSAWGTTPGKFLLRVSVRTPDIRFKKTEFSLASAGEFRLLAMKARKK
ncbi:MAG: RDD family protein [Waddliaceae bacterium]